MRLEHEESIFPVIEIGKGYTTLLSIDLSDDDLKEGEIVFTVKGNGRKIFVQKMDEAREYIVEIPKEVAAGMDVSTNRYVYDFAWYRRGALIKQSNLYKVVVKASAGGFDGTDFRELSDGTDQMNIQKIVLKTNLPFLVGKDGEDGFSPIISVREDGNDYIITITDASGEKEPIRISKGSTEEEIGKAVEKYLEEHPVEGLDEKKLKEYLDTHKYVTEDKIPTKTSDLTNDSNYITRAVNDLANYYLKSESYTKEEVNQLIGEIPKFSILPVDTLPTQNISTTTVYLLKDSEKEGNLYTEYIYVNGKWEILGSQSVDLTGYAKEDWVNAQIADLVDKETFDEVKSQLLESIAEIGKDVSDVKKDLGGVSFKVIDGILIVEYEEV